MKTRIANWLVVIGIILASVFASGNVANAQNAQAAAKGQCTGLYCGNFYNGSSINVVIGAINNWGENYTKVVPQYQWARQATGWQDVDGYYIGSGWCARQWSFTGSYWSFDGYVGSGNRKIGDWPQKRVEAYLC